MLEEMFYATSLVLASDI